MAGESTPTQAASELFQIAPDHRFDVSIHHRRAGAFVLAILTAELVREGDQNFWTLLVQNLFHVQFMRRIGVAMQETHGDRLDALGTDLSCNSGSFGVVKRR